MTPWQSFLASNDGPRFGVRVQRLARLRIVLAGVIAIASGQDTLAEEVADLVIQRAQIRTLDPNLPRATALAVKGDRLVAVGNEAAVARWIGSATRVLDLAGKAIVPGFIDAHLHPSPIYPEEAPWATIDVSPQRAGTMAELIAVLKRKADSTPAGQWVVGRGYQETKLGRHPTRHDLDQASRQHPIQITHSSGHRSASNSLALQLAKVDRHSPDPRGGAFERDARGEPTGVLLEAAGRFVRSAGPERPAEPESAAIDGYRARFHRYAQHGLTSVHVAGTNLEAVRLMTAARAAAIGSGQMAAPIRLYCLLREPEIETLARLKQDGRLGNQEVRLGGVKISHGNSLSGQTCWLSEPYVGRPGYFGLPPARSQDALNDLVLKIHAAGLQVCVHSNGDREIAMVLTALEHAQAQHPRAETRHRIEHCSVVTPAILERMRRLNVLAIPHSYIFEHGDKLEPYGPARWDWMFAARSMLELGIPIAGHSDDPVSPAEPLLRMQDMLLRTTADGKVIGARQRITLEQALAVWTTGGAYASYEEDVKGSLTVGKLADFVVLAGDPGDRPAETLRQLPIERTYIGGQLVYERSDSETPAAEVRR